MQIDQSLIKSCLAMKREGQKQLYLLLLPYLRAVATRYLRDQSYVKDVLQESFIKIFKNLKNYKPEIAPFKSWAARIVINVSLNYNQRKISCPKEEIGTEAHEIIIFPSIIQELSNADLLKILKQMPPGYFEVFNLFIIDGYTHDEISNILSISNTTSRKKLSRAKQWLKKKFPDFEKPNALENILPKNLN